MRLDQYLVYKGLCTTRTEAQRAIKAGRVQLSGEVMLKCAQDISIDTDIMLIGEGCPFVSRGGEKLRGAIEHFKLDVNGVVALDIGASTGGFTDCLLQNGAVYVYALENGCGQLHAKLLADARVRSIEHTNARYITKELFDSPITFVTMDVSFISQKLILPVIADILEPDGTLVTLIKPQFEVGRAYIGKGGIVKDVQARDAAVREVCAFAENLGFMGKGLMDSPILGGDGNREYLACFVKQREEIRDDV